MKKMIEMLILVGVVMNGCAQTDGYIIKGTIAGGDSTLYLTAVNELGERDTLQKVNPAKGQFTMKGKVDRPQFCYLTVAGGKGNMPLLLEDTVFTVDIRNVDLTDVRNYTVNGGNLQAQKSALDAREIEIFKERDSVLIRFYEAEKENNIFGKMHEMASLQIMGEFYDREENACIAANSDNIFGLGLLFYRYKFLSYEQLKKKFAMLSEAMKDTPEGRLIAARYDLLGEVKVGAYAPNFKLPTLTGDTIHLYGKSARVKIIDFWASWCGPCRKENPHLVEIYKKYKDKDLLMISVSMDTDEKSWKNAVKADGLEWIQACNLKGASGEVARDYRITGIPHVFILDGNNRIIAEGVRGDEIDKVLEERLK